MYYVCHTLYEGTREYKKRIEIFIKKSTLGRPLNLTKCADNSTDATTLYFLHLTLTITHIIIKVIK